jgi:hypothetical protein
LSRDNARDNAYVLGGVCLSLARKLLHPALESAAAYAQFEAQRAFSMGIVTKRCFLCNANKGIL